MEVIKAFLFSIELLDILDKVILSTLIGVAASHIKGSMIYAILGIGIGSGLANMANKTNRRNALRNKRVLIIDEIGITSKNLLYCID
jgi:DNA replication protein DnaC